MPQSVVDHLSNEDEHVSKAVRELSRSEHKLAVFRFVYYHKKKCKTVDEIIENTDLTRKQVLNAGNKLVAKHLVAQPPDKPTRYCKVPGIAALKERILRLASDPLKAKAVIEKKEKASTTIITTYNKHVGDTYKVGQAGAVGKDARAENMTFQQVWIDGDFDAATLAKELETLRKHLRETDDSADADTQVGILAQAEKAATSGDGPGAIAYLKNASKSVLATAKAIGVNVAAAVIAKSIGAE